jgi:hypothetical protein
LKIKYKTKYEESLTSSRFTGTPIDIRCSLLTLDRVQSRGFRMGAVVSCA